MERTEPARVTNAPLTKMLTKTLCRVIVIPATSGTVKASEDNICNIVSADRVTVAPYNTPSDDRIDLYRNMQSANHRRDEDITEEGATHPVGEFLV